MKIATLDLECTSFSAVGPGFLLCTVIKPLGEKAEVFRYDTYHCKIGRETDLVKAVINRIGHFDLIVGYNSENFDFRWLVSRSMALGLDMCLNPLSYDLYKAVKRLGIKTEPGYNGKPRAGLKHIVDFLGIENTKTEVYQREWWNSVWEKGEKRGEALDKIVEHCVADVELTEKLYWKLLPVDTRVNIRRWRM